MSLSMIMYGLCAAVRGDLRFGAGEADAQSRCALCPPALPASLVSFRQSAAVESAGQWACSVLRATSLDFGARVLRGAAGWFRGSLFGVAAAGFGLCVCLH